MPSRRVLYVAALMGAGCAGASPVNGGPSRDEAPCRFTSAEVWAIDNSPSTGSGLTTAETVKRLAEVHIDLKASAVERLAEDLEEIATRPCQAEPHYCSNVRAVAVVELRGPGGCARQYVASRDSLIDVTSMRIGRVGEGFLGVFNLDVWRNCTAHDAVALLMTKEVRVDMPPGAELSRLEQIERREVLGPMKWAEFRRAKPELAQEVEPDVPPVLNKRDFFYIRLGRANANGAAGDEWTREAFVTQTDCTVLEVPRKR